MTPAMTGPRVGNAPVSWGALEFEGLQGASPGYALVLDEIRATGYDGTELGDWGFMPTDPAILRAELDRRQLTVIGAFVPIPLKNSDAHAAGEARALQVARLLAAVVAPGDGASPCVVLADDNGTDPVRTRHAGRVTPEMGLSSAEWRVFAMGAERIARAIRDRTGLPTVFHHHCAGYVETPAETARLLDLTDPDLLGLAFDTGHYTFGSGGAGPQVVDDALDRFGDRIRHVHFKDCHPAIAAQSRTEGWDYFEAVRRGVFCELGQGAVDFPAVVAHLRDRAYQGWIVVEQDVLPGLGTPRESAQRNRRYLASIGL
jgi:inosose dehydratase